jgi:hypothetical protein
MSGTEGTLKKRNRPEIAADFYALILADLERYKGNLDRLADGVYVEDDRGRVYTTPPDRQANIYLIDRVLGRPNDSSTPPATKIYVEYRDDPDDPASEAPSGAEIGGEPGEPV